MKKVLSIVLALALVLCSALAAAEGACAVTAYDALGGLRPLDELEARIASGWETL